MSKTIPAPTPARRALAKATDRGAIEVAHPTRPELAAQIVRAAGHAGFDVFSMSIHGYPLLWSINVHPRESQHVRIPAAQQFLAFLGISDTTLEHFKSSPAFSTMQGTMPNGVTVMIFCDPAKEEPVADTPVDSPYVDAAAHIEQVVNAAGIAIRAIHISVNGQDQEAMIQPVDRAALTVAAATALAEAIGVEDATAEPREGIYWIVKGRTAAGLDIIVFCSQDEFSDRAQDLR